MFGIVPKLQARVLEWPAIKGSDRMTSFMKHPAGPFTIHFWAPFGKWLISIANIMDLQRPVDKMSAPQQSAVAVTGLIWSYYSTQIIPVNYSLLLVNFCMGLTGIWHVGRILKARYLDAPGSAAPALPSAAAVAAAAAAQSGAASAALAAAAAAPAASAPPAAAGGAGALK